MCSKLNLFVLMIGFVSGLGTILPAQTLTLQECLQRAQKNSFRLKAEEERSQVALKRYYQERAQSLPQIYGDLAHEQRYLKPYHFEQQWALVRGEWALGAYLLKTARAAHQNMLMVKAEKEQTRLALIRRVSLAYGMILQKQTRNSLLKKRLELLQAHLTVAKALWQAGTRTQLDVLQTKNELSLLQEKIAVLDMEKATLEQELIKLIEWRESAKPRLVPMNAAAVASTPVPKIDPAILALNPILQALNFQIKEQQMRRREATAERLPRFQASGGYFVDRDPTGDGSYWVWTAGFSVPLFRWGAISLQRQEVEAVVRSLTSQKKEVERELFIRASQIRERLSHLKEILVQQNRRLKTTENAFHFAEMSYQAGLITNLDYLSAQQQFTETQIAIQETQLEYVMNLVDFYVMTNQVEKIEEMGHG